MILYVVALVGGGYILGKIARRSDNVRQTGWRLGVAILITWIAYAACDLTPTTFDWQESIPLQVCDVVSLLGAIVLLKPFRIGRAVLFFCAFPLTTQAIITPDGTQDPSTIRFWLFWTLHGSILVASFYDVVFERYRPTVRDFVYVAVVDVAYFAVVVPLDIVFKWNYGYIGSANPESKTLITSLGPWPQRIFIIAGLGFAAQLVFYIIWRSTERFRTTTPTIVAG